MLKQLTAVCKEYLTVHKEYEISFPFCHPCRRKIATLQLQINIATPMLDRALQIYGLLTDCHQTFGREENRIVRKVGCSADAADSGNALC